MRVRIIFSEIFLNGVGLESLGSTPPTDSKEPVLALSVRHICGPRTFYVSDQSWSLREIQPDKQEFRNLTMNCPNIGA